MYHAPWFPHYLDVDHLLRLLQFSQVSWDTVLIIIHVLKMKLAYRG